MIAERFLLCVDEILASHQFKSERTFCERYGINRGNLYQLRQDPSRKIFTADWLTFLVEDFGYSAEWLITGKGEQKRASIGQQTCNKTPNTP